MDDVAEIRRRAGDAVVAASGPLEAETVAAALLESPRLQGVDRHLAELFLAGVIIEPAAAEASATSAGLLRSLAAVAPPPLRRLAVRGLGRVTAAGHYPPPWSACMGRAVPLGAWCRQDVFGDTAVVVVTFDYDGDDHALLVGIDRCREPVLLWASVVADRGRVAQLVQESGDPLARWEEIDLARARGWIEGALVRSDRGRFAELDDDSLATLPIVRARIRRLPEPANPLSPPAGAEERERAEADFLASPQAAAVWDAEAVEFWARVLAGFGTACPGDTPTRIGPGKLSRILLDFVPATLSVTDRQRAALPDSARAWTAWAAQAGSLPLEAVARLEERLTEILDAFEEVCDDPLDVVLRRYLADVVPTTLDGGILEKVRWRRYLAVPPPWQRVGPDEHAELDVADPAVREAITLEEFRDCEPGGAATPLLKGAVDVVERLWQGDPDTCAAAERLCRTGLDDHAVLHALVDGAGR